MYINIKLDLRKWDVKFWTRFLWLAEKTVSGSRERGNERSGAMKHRVFFFSPAEL